jgi:hypothetical protein
MEGADSSALAPVLVIAVSLGHYTVVRGETLTAAIAFVRHPEWD